MKQAFLHHVGDTLGMVVLGYPDTTLVTMADMNTMCAPWLGQNPRLWCGDLPFGSYDTWRTRWRIPVGW